MKKIVMGLALLASSFVWSDNSQLVKEALGLGDDVTVEVGTDWQTGQPYWSVNRDLSYDGKSCAEACFGGDYENKTFSLTVNGPGTLSFVAKCSVFSSLRMFVVVEWKPGYNSYPTLIDFFPTPDASPDASVSVYPIEGFGATA